MCLTLWAAFSVRDPPFWLSPFIVSPLQVGKPLLVIFFFVLQLIALLWYVEWACIMCTHQQLFVCLFVQVCVNLYSLWATSCIELSYVHVLLM